MATYLIDFIDTATAQNIEDYFTENNCLVKKHLSNLNKVYLVESETEPIKTDLIQWIVNDDTSSIKLLGEEPIGTTTLEVASTLNIDLNADKDWWKIYSLYSVDFSNPSLTLPVHKTDNCVFVLDSGIQANHPEFTGRRIELFYSFLGTNFDDNSGHGTALASLINGNTCSMVDCDLKVVKIFDKNVETKQSDILNALNEIGTFINTHPNKFVVLNMSWAIPKNEFIESKIQVLRYMGAAIVAAAGNSGQPISDVTPAGMDDVITIGSYNSSFLPSNFSDYQGTSETSFTAGSTNHGELDGWAPGENIYVSSITSNQYGFVAGTSYSAAIFSAGLVYNSQGELQETNRAELFRMLGQDPVSNITASALGRENLLDLSDPKYQFCKNKITTYYAMNAFQLANKLADQTSKMSLRTNKMTTRTVFSPHIVKSFEWITPPPSWVRKYGEFLIFDIKTEPVTDKDFYQLKIKINGAENLEGQSAVITYDILHIPSTFDIDAVPENDPILDYVLLGPGLNCMISCVNDCWAGSPICCGASLFVKTGCYCGGPASCL